MSYRRTRVLVICTLALLFVAAGLGVYLVMTKKRASETVAKVFRPLIVPAFEVLYYAEADSTWHNTHWHGNPILKNPMDLWSYQEIIHTVKPDWIIECGTYSGASALYFAHMLDIVGKGRVITFDVKDWPGKPTHPRIEYFLYSSTSEDALRIVRERVKPEDAVLVSLDSLHTKDHVLRELQLYSPFVSMNSYIVVEDTNVNGHPVFPDHGPGPMEAVREFLGTTHNFRADPGPERFMLTFNPRGYLKRIS